MSSTKSLEIKKQLILNFQGPMCAVVTPYNSDGSLNLKQIIPYAEHLSEIGVKGVYILGTTGESFVLTLEEKICLVQTWHKALCHLDNNKYGRLLAIVNVSAMPVKEVIALARTVEKLDHFDGLALLQPLFYKVANENQMVEYARQILNETEMKLPLLYYHFPDRTVKLESFVEMALKKLPPFCAIKFTDVNIVRLGIIQNRFGDRLKIFVGYDETLLAAKTSFNIDAGICATFSFDKCVQNYLSMLDSVDNGNLEEAQQNQRSINEVCLELQSNGNFFASLKQRLNEHLSSKGINFGQARSPIWIQSQ